MTPAAAPSRAHPSPTATRDRAAPEAPAGHINLLGVRVSVLNLSTATEAILAAIRAGRRGYVCIRDVHGVVRAQDDTALREAHNRAFLVTPDGMPLVWALKLAGHRDAGRVYGPDLMLRLFDVGRAAGVTHYLYGGSEAVLEKLRTRLRAKFPGAEIVGAEAPPFRPLSEAEEATAIERINASGADIVWVGLGTPKQELLMARLRERLTPAMLIGVGAAFDFHAGVKPQAPRFVRHSGFEWLFRLASEPRRLLPRYAVAVPRFLMLGAAQTLRLKRFPLDLGSAGETLPRGREA